METQTYFWPRLRLKPIAGFPPTHQVVDADAVPALHDGQEGDDGGNHPAAPDHQGHSHRGHLVPVDQRLAADSVVPEEGRSTEDEYQQRESRRESVQQNTKIGLNSF